MKKNTLILIGSLIVFVSLLIARSIYQKQTAEIKNIQKGMAEEQQKGAILTRIAATESIIKKYSQYLPSTEDNRWLLEQLGDIADQTGVSLLSISPRLPKEGDKYVSLSVDAEIRCDYNQLGNFISKLESSPQLIRLDSLQLTVVRDSGDNVNIAAQMKPLARVKLTVSTLYLK